MKNKKNHYLIWSIGRYAPVKTGDTWENSLPKMSKLDEKAALWNFGFCYGTDRRVKQEIVAIKIRTEIGFDFRYVEYNPMAIRVEGNDVCFSIIFA